MPLISVVVTAHGVGEYLTECLDSILKQPFTDVEVIGVDDCSPDHSGVILEAFAAADARVRAVHLPANIGLGRARGAGFAETSSPYVWFVDGDDRLSDGALAAVARSIDAHEPDMVVVDYLRDSWERDGTRSGLTSVLDPDETPPVFSARTRPAVFATLHTAWSRVVRAPLVARAGAPFHPGWYEDVSFTFPLLVAARRICVLPRVCYRYRDTRVGAITATRDARHFDVFEQYDRVFATLDRWGVDRADDVRRHIFERMLWHYRAILHEQSRVPVELEQRFFARMSEHVRGFGPPARRPGLEGIKRGLITHGSWRTFAMLRSAQRWGRAGADRFALRPRPATLTPRP